MKIRETISDALELPKDTFLNLPRIILTGNREVYIENYKGIIEYTDTLMRLNTGARLLKITGSGLGIVSIGADDIIVGGEISTVEFV
jgi:sporulation protein YqfC